MCDLDIVKINFLHALTEILSKVTLISLGVIKDMPTVTELLKDHVTLSVECIDRMYLNGYIPY